MIILHQGIVPLHTIKNNLQENVRFLKIIYVAIDVIKEWDTKYINAPSQLVMKTRQGVDLERDEIQTLIQGNKQLNA